MPDAARRHPHRPPGERARAHRPARARRPEADRPHAAIEPRDLHRSVRRRARDLRRHRPRPRARLHRRPLLVQRRRRSLRDLPRRGLRVGRAALPARQLRPVPRPATARGTTPRPSRSPTTGKSIADVLALTVEQAAEFLAAVPAAARSLQHPARGRARLPAPRPARDRAVGRRGAAHQARDGAAAGATRPHPLPARRADDRAASGRRATAARAAARARRLAATPSSSSSTRWTSSRRPTG